MGFVKLNKILSLFIMVLVLSSLVFAAEPVPAKMKLNLQSLDNYIVTLSIKEDNSASVIQSFEIVNRYKEPIIPGRAKLVLFKGLNPHNIVVSIGGSRKAINADDVVVEDGNSVIYYEIWRPITKGEALKVDVSFDTVIETQGILFKQLNLNFGEPELPIDKMVFNLILPQGRRVTYSEPSITSNNGNSVVVEIPQEMIKNFQQEPIDIEYSILPLPVLPFHGYWLWLSLIIMSLMIMVLRIISKQNIDRI